MNQKFEEIIKVLIQYEKPLIFHNGIYDILLIYQQFIEDLPKNIYEF